MKNAIVIVNYNRKELLAQCLLSLRNAQPCEHAVFVVDNGSADGSIAMVQNAFPEVLVIDMGYNAGFCKANNVGIQTAIDHGAQNIILLNNDTEVDPAFITELVARVDKKDHVEMVAPKILMYANKSVIDSAGLVITPDGMAINRLMDKTSSEANDACEVFCPAGAAALFSTRLLNDIKQEGMFFDEEYAYYLEDLDMGWRARLRGWKCQYNPRSIVYHHKNATSGGYSKFIAFHTNRNLFYNIIKNYPGCFFWKAIFLSVIRYPYLLTLSMRGTGVVKRFQKNVSAVDLACVTLRGFWDVIKNMRALCRKRRYIQRRRVAQDFSTWFKNFGVGFFASKK
ncbi:MAG: glycosyltransferase family 2 protein [Parcubacteria group bacterium]|jgi:hypothetical protein